jgi:2-polyprenyl-6-methoxyphenol hydroxylase-like FAD-dependent oxidoreductase
MKTLDVVIVGAGIGGLATALALAADGHRVTILDAVKEFTEVDPRRISSHSLLTFPRSAPASEFLQIL